MTQKHAVTPTDINGNIIEERSIVTIVGTNCFTDYQGLVVDTASDLDPEDGPIAVFFDHEVPYYKFNILFYDEIRRNVTVPTKEAYRDSPRVVCFEPNELRVEKTFSRDTRIKRLFGAHLAVWQVLSPNFELIPEAHECHFEDCESGFQATEETLVNCWGSVYVIYACKKCHEKRNGMLTESLMIKSPLPRPV